MPATHSPALAVLPELPNTEFQPLGRPGPEVECWSALDQLRSVLNQFPELPADGEWWTRLLTARRSVGSQIARWPRKDCLNPLIHEAHGLIREMAKSGIHDHRADPEDLAQAQAMVRKGWPGVLAAMLLVPAWQWPAAPLLLEVPDWLRADYVRWLFAAPQNFTATGQAEAYAAYTLKRLEEMLRWMNRAPDAAQEMKVLGAYASRSSLLPACLGPGHLRHQAELRAQLLQRAMGCRDDHHRAPLKPRAGRRLRIGIIHRHFEANPEVYATLPLFQQLDPERFEVVLFTYVNDFGRIEEHCRQKASDMIVLPADLKEQLTLLRNTALDVLLFGTNVTADCNVVTRLALHRVAPLQVVHSSSGITSGLPEIDLYVTGALAATEQHSAHFSERLGLMAGPTHAFELEADREERQVACTRADFGLPEGSVVFVSSASFQKIIPEMQHTWARVLAATPGSYLLLHPFHSGQPSGHTINHFHAEFEAVLQGEGVDPARLVASTVNFPTRTDVQGLVALGDVYLDTFPFSAVDALVDPLAFGLPVVAWQGDALRSRTGASLLRSLGLDELVSRSAEEYQTLAVKLANDGVYRQGRRDRIRQQMERVPVFLDSRKTSQAFGELMELAFDELSAKGRIQFRTNHSPLRVEQDADAIRCG